MKITVTGGSGFIGSRVAGLLASSHDVTIFDVKSPSISGVKFVKGNIMDADSVQSGFKGSDIVVHLAGLLGVQKTESNPIETLDVNITGTRNVMEACRCNDIRKVVYSSSSEVYGEPIKIPIEESDSPIPITVYGVSKLAAEEYVKAFTKRYSMKYTMLRFFSVYGPGQTTDFVIPRFVDLALKNMPLTIHGDGSQVRAFCHVKDIAYGVSLALERGDGETFNIGNNEELIKIKDLAMKIISMTSSNSTTQFLPYDEPDRKRIKDIINRMPSLEKAWKLLGYEPKVTLNEGISDVIHSLKGVSQNALSTRN